MKSANLSLAEAEETAAVVNQDARIGVVGAGAMGTGIAQLAASFEHWVVIHDASSQALSRSRAQIERNLHGQVEKGRLTDDQARTVLSRLRFSEDLGDFAESDLVIEAVVEDLKVKQDIFRKLEEAAPSSAILATNTSSLSVASIASACRKNSSRVLGIHFFNPAIVMPLVEIVPALTTNSETTESARKLVDSWKKSTVIAKDTPGFIVNRIARPYYGEALRIVEEGLADIATVDWAMKELGGFKMGPFELMDFIGNDVNYKVTESVFEAFYYDPRYRPSLVQRRLVEAGHLGRKSGQGHYDYRSGVTPPEPNKDKRNGQVIFMRILAMLINEAADALYLQIASAADIDLAMTKGVNYPKGLLSWADELGVKAVLSKLEELHAEYCEDRYRPSPLLRRMAKNSEKFHV